MMSEAYARTPKSDHHTPARPPVLAGDALSAARDDARDVLRAIFLMSPLPMVLADPSLPDSPMVFANRAFCQLTGYAEEEVLGRNCRFLQGEKTDPAAVGVLREAIAAGVETQVDMWNYRKDGTAFWNTMFVGPVRDRHGKLLFLFGSQLDGTAKLEAEEARVKAARMDTLGSLAAGIAHEFNNLMTVAIGNIEGVGADPLTPRQKERLERVDWAARAAGKLTQQILSFSGKQGLAAEIIDLNTTIREFDGLLSQAAGEAAVEYELGLGPLTARIDARQLQLSLINLVRNAGDASPARSKVVVATRRLPATGADEVEIAVIDTGTGMPPDVAARAAEPFFTTKEHGQGTGLGLAMVAGFCRQSGGRMLVETETGRGTTIRLIFPERR